MEEDKNIIIPNDCILSIYAADNGVRITYSFDDREVGMLFLSSKKCSLILSHILLKFDETKRVVKIGVKENDVLPILELTGENILELIDALYTVEYARIESGLNL